MRPLKTKQEPNAAEPQEEMANVELDVGQEQAPFENRKPPERCFTHDAATIVHVKERLALAHLELPVLIALGLETNLFVVLFHDDGVRMARDRPIRWHHSRILSNPLRTLAQPVVCFRFFPVLMAHRRQLVKILLFGAAKEEQRDVAPWVLVIDPAPKRDKQRQERSGQGCAPPPIRDRLAVEVALEP